MTQWRNDEGLRVGARYQAQMTDCCIEGTFTATLVGTRTNAEIGGDWGEMADEVGELTFDNGLVLETWGQVRFTELEETDATR